MSFNLWGISDISDRLVPKNNTTNQSSISDDILSWAKTMAQKFTPDAQDIKSLLIQSWNLIKNNPILRGPFYKLLKIHIIYCLIFYVSLSLAFYPFFGWATFIFITLLLLFIWLPLVWFITTGQQGRMSLMLYKIEKNEVFDIASINTEINQVRSKLREITWASILESTIRTSLTGKWGILSMVVIFFISAIREAWDLMYNYIIPAVVVEKKEHWSDYVENFKKLTQKIPATLIGVFGIDFSEAWVGGLFSGILVILFIIWLLIWVWVGYLQLFMGWGLWAIVLAPSFAIHLLPIVLTIMIIHMILWVKRIAFSMMKTMYFTLLYISLQCPELLDKNSGLKDYLTLNGKR